MKKYYFDAKNARFIKLLVIGFYGNGGGLQYFNSKYTEDTRPEPSLTGKGISNY